MSILFVLLTFLLILTVMYFRKPQAAEDALQVANGQQVSAPMMMQLNGFEIPRGYAFHPGHTWLNDEGHQNARVGLDAFAANLLGQIDSIEFAELNRWVRQGQRLCTIMRGGRKVELLSPVEGVLTSTNHELLKNPALAVDDPYKDGWLCTIKAPELSINSKNLLQGPIVPAWMKNSVARVGEMLTQLTPALAQDGGLPIEGAAVPGEPRSAAATDEGILPDIGRRRNPASMERAMPNQKAMLIDIKRCIGCLSCETACKQLHGFGARPGTHIVRHSVHRGREPRRQVCAQAVHALRRSGLRLGLPGGRHQ